MCRLPLPVKVDVAGAGIGQSQPAKLMCLLPSPVNRNQQKMRQLPAGQMNSRLPGNLTGNSGYVT
jgi:DNA-binding transcriptional regulator YdaS (Cro superfamily)